MFNATYFTYDGVFSGIYGLMIADFNDEAIAETSAFSPVLNTIKPATVNRFFHDGIKYEAPPQYQFSIISATEISDIFRREILSWLIGRNKFKKLEIHQPDLEGYHYNCVFTDAQIIHVNGRCHGFRITANFDSPYVYGDATIKEKTLSGVCEEVYIDNKSDVIDGYVYPSVSFKSSEPCDADSTACSWAESQKSLYVDGNPTSDYNICIINESDDPNRRFIFAGLMPNEEITVDNELRHIKSSIGGEKLSNFNKNWLRLRPGVNKLKISINGEVSIKCPHYAMIGF